MAHQENQEQLMHRDDNPSRLRTIGMRSWLYLGIVVWSAIVFAFLSAISGLVVPLIIAIIIGMLFYPVVDWLAVRGLPRALGSLLVMLLLLVVLAAALWLMIVGILDQTGEISRQVNAGLAALRAWVAALDLPVGIVEHLVTNALNVAPGVASGLAAVFSSTFSSAIAFLMGMFVGLFLLFYILSDWHTLSTWVGRNLGVPEALGREIITDITTSMRLYFYALTLSSIVVSVSIGLTMALLGLPLAFTIALVTLVTSYIPYLGAIFSGVFAFLVALGAGGLGNALIVLVVVLVMQNVIQTLMQNKMASDQLNLHPLVTFMSVIVGAALAGLLGATLANPVTAVLIRTTQRLRTYPWEPEVTRAELLDGEPTSKVG